MCPAFAGLPGPRRKYSWSRCVCVRMHTREDYCRGWAVAACVLRVIRAGFKRPNVFRELKLLTGVGVAPPRNCGTLAALMRAFPSLPRIIPAFAAREHRSTTCGLPLSAYGRPPCVNAIRHPDTCIRFFSVLDFVQLFYQFSPLSEFLWRFEYD